jgi:hypothetical protein
MGNYDDMTISWGEPNIGRWSLLFGENILRRRFGLVFLVLVLFCLVLEMV